MCISIQEVSYWPYILLSSNTWEKIRINEVVHQLLAEFKKVNDSVRREDLYNILIEFGIIMKLVRLIKMRLNETCNWVRVGKRLSEVFAMKSGLREGDALQPMFFNFALEYVIRNIPVNQDGLKLNGTY